MITKPPQLTGRSEVAAHGRPHRRMTRGARPGPAGLSAHLARSRWLNPVAVIIALAPLAWLALGFFTGRLGANPIEEILNRLGWWALFLLTASLACTPAKILLRSGWPVRLRRTLGLLAFFYAALHLAFYVGVDRFFNWPVILQDLTRRRFQVVGFLAFLILAPLAVTSTRGMIRRLGNRRWKRLHRLVYLAAALGVVHFAWRVKADAREPFIFGAVLAGLLAIRWIGRIRRRRGERPGPAP